MKKIGTILIAMAMALTATACGGNAAISSTSAQVSTASQSTESASGSAVSGADGETSEAMSAAEVYAWIAENDELDYTVPETAMEFIDSNSQFFPGSDKNTGAMSDFVDYDADYPHIAKNPAKYADKLMSIGGDIVDCKENETEQGVITYLQIQDYSGYSYCLYYLGSIEDAFEGYSAWGYALPFGTVTFDNVGGYYTQAVIGAACYIEVENYDEYSDHL